MYYRIFLNLNSVFAPLIKIMQEVVDFQRNVLDECVTTVSGGVGAAFTDEDSVGPEAVHLISLWSSIGLQGSWNAELLSDVSVEQRSIITTVRCLAHSVQLVVNGGIKNAVKRVRTIIALCRTVAKALRIPSTQRELISANVFTIRPKMEVPTRWCSTFNLVSQIHTCLLCYG